MSADEALELEQFAWTRIHGAVLDELRRHDWVPRSLRRWDREVSKARHQFVGLYGRKPTGEELASAMGVTLTAWRRGSARSPCSCTSTT